MTDKTFSESIRKAMNDFGDDIILDRKLIGILKDYHGFSTLPPAELITRIIIESGAIRRLIKLKTSRNENPEEILFREVGNLETQYGFSEKYLRKTLISILDGIGVNMAIGKDEIKIKEEEKPFQNIGNDLSKPLCETIFKNTDILDLRKIPSGKDYLDLRKNLCTHLGGKLLTEYKSGVNKHALFTCDIHPYFKNVEIKVIAEGNTNIATTINIVLVHRNSKSATLIRKTVDEVELLLEKVYSGHKSISNLRTEYFSDESVARDFRLAQKEDNDLTLKDYLLDEGTVNCKIVYSPNGFSLVLCLHISGTSTLTNSKSRNLLPLPPLTPDSDIVNYNYKERPEYEKLKYNSRKSFEEVRRKLKKFISIKYGIPRMDIKNDDTLEELEDLSSESFDLDELIEEIEDEFMVFLDEDLIDENMTINELTREILDIIDD